jgi:hypothetical protein
MIVAWPGCFDIAGGVVTKTLTAVKEATPPTRIIPVEKTIQAGQTVYTFDQLSRYIDSADAIAVGHCYCRHQAQLLGEESCDAPRECCMNFGPGARYTAERGITRMITKEEAHAILEECEEHGLVHLSSNTSEFLEYLCNCCSCHCDLLHKLKETDKPIWIASSGYVATVDEELCQPVSERSHLHGSASASAFTTGDRQGPAPGNFKRYPECHGCINADKPFSKEIPFFRPAPRPVYSW